MNRRVYVSALIASLAYATWHAGPCFAADDGSFRYYYSNAGVVATLNTKTSKLYIRDESMSALSCSTAAMPICLSVPYLEIVVAVPLSVRNLREWRVGDRLFCMRGGDRNGAQEADKVVFVDSELGASVCEEVGREQTFIYSEERGLLLFSKSGTHSRIVFSLLDVEGFGAAELRPELVADN